jgi:hypothetical protein
MSSSTFKRRLVAGVAGASTGLGILLGLAGCTTAERRSGPVSASENASEAGQTEADSPAGSDGARLWAQNCSSCHSLREPGFYNDAQWEVVMFHMRVRGNLTKDEHRAVLEFLRSAN